MHTFETACELNHDHHGRGQTGQVCHTFPQIAMILAERGGEAISPARVEQICRAAEAKLVRALLTDALAPSRPPIDAATDRALHLRGDGDVRFLFSRIEQ